jgi:hypothetical protein
MSARTPTFRMMLIARKAGRYDYIIGRSDESEWLQRSSESFSSMAAVAKAGRKAIEIKAHKLSEQRRPDAS